MEIRKLSPGDRILDYRILERLGEGGFGEVFRAEHEVLDRIVAIKVPRDQGALTALRHEGVVQASLEHPNIVRTLELSISHDPPYVVMEYIDGSSLAERIQQKGALPWRKASRILLDAARALSFAHKRGVIHGDVKPGNILLERGKQGRVLLTDFGLGRIFEGPQGSLQISRSLELATSGAEVQGTIRYLAPELLRGETADERADLYSFSVLLFEVLTGRLPEGREVPSDLVQDIPEKLDRIFERMFTRRERRPRSFDPTIEELEALAEPGAPQIVRAIPAEPTPKPVVRSAAQRHSPRAPAPRRRRERPKASNKLEAFRLAPGFDGWREALLGQISGRLGAARGITSSDGRGYDICYGVSAEGEPHHRVYALVLPKLDAAAARATVAEARRIFDQEKGIWEKEVTFWVIAREVEDHDQVLWAFKSFSMGWWRRRRIVLQDAGAERLFATELGCDPRGNPLKRAFLEASQEALQDVPSQLAETRPRPRQVRGTAWGAALALIMTFGLLGSIMAVELASRKMRFKQRATPAKVDSSTLAPIPSAVPVEFTPADQEPPELY